MLYQIKSNAFAFKLVQNEKEYRSKYHLVSTGAKVQVLWGFSQKINPYKSQPLYGLYINCEIVKTCLDNDKITREFECKRLLIIKDIWFVPVEFLISCNSIVESSL